MARTLGAALVLLGFGTAFAAAALGTTLLVADDHPGQLFRLIHVLTHGPAPWAWNTGWFAGYPELQFYPPAFAYAGALLHRVSLGVLSVAATYQTLLWWTYLLPGLTALVALARLTRDGWLALPGAFVVLTLSAGLASGVEGGVHTGMAPARLGWALLPLLVVALRRWTDEGGRFPFATAVPLLALVTLTHPAHLPAAVALVATCAALGVPGVHRVCRLAVGAAALGLAASLTAFWTLPLLARLDETRALAWGDLAVGRTLLAHPLLIVLLVLAALARPLARTRAGTAVALWPWVAGALVALDALVLEPLGLRWLPADRVADGAWLAVILAAGLTVARGLEAVRRGPRLLRASAALLALILISLPGSTLTLWARALEWPGYEATVRGLRLDALWAALRAAPPGRVLFVRSSVPLVYGTAWWRPHTHLTALTPLAAGRGIVNGTFTHPSPIAALVYRGSAGPGAITSLVERLDGRSLFGRPLEALDGRALTGYADRLGVSAVVALDEDVSRLAALDDDTAFARLAPIGPFLIWVRRVHGTLPREIGRGYRGDARWEVTLDGRPGEWVAARVAYYPLWRADVDGRALPTRRGELGDLEVRLDRGGGPGEVIGLVYAPGPPEIAGVVVSVAGLLALGLTCRALRAAPRPDRSAS
ncbi:MAG: hypothetical protein ACRELS_12105 [Candidatus Rokuibacteriota bacterium]